MSQPLSTIAPPEGRYALELCNGIYGDPYICEIAWLPTKADAEWTARELLPLVDDAAKWELVTRATAQLHYQLQAQVDERQLGESVWDAYGVAAPDLVALIKAIEDRSVDKAHGDWRSWTYVLSEQKDHDGPGEHDPHDSCSPVYEEQYTGSGNG